MIVPMMDVRIMRMAVGERFMPVSMRVRLGAVPVEIVRVAMMRIVHVRMDVGERVVPVQVPVVLGKVQDNPGRHQDRCGPVPGIGLLAEQHE